MQEDIGAVSGMLCSDDAYMFPVCEDYYAAIEMVEREEEIEEKCVLMPYNNAVLWKKSALDALGEFEECTNGMDAVMIDYCIRMIMSGRKIMICSNALLWKNMNSYSKKGYSLEDCRQLEGKWGMHYFNWNL